jgi:hypothetical protein
MENMIWFLIGALISNLITTIYLKITFGRRLDFIDKYYKDKNGTEPIKDLIETKSQLK